MFVRRLRLALLAFALTSQPMRLGAQVAPGSFERTLFASKAFANGATRSGAQAFAIEAAGGSAGSLLGFGLVVLAGTDDCEVEDTGCYIEKAITGIALGTATSAAGAYVAGGLFDTRPSAAGATIGAVAGAAAGLGMWHLFTEELDLVNKTGPAVLVYSITQGVVAALGSRLVAALR